MKLLFLLPVLWLTACTNSKTNSLSGEDEENSWTDKEYDKAVAACVKNALSYTKYEGAEDDCKCAMTKISKLISFEDAMQNIIRRDG